MVGESNQNVILIQIDAEFEISEFEISRVDCTQETLLRQHNVYLFVSPAVSRGDT